MADATFYHHFNGFRVQTDTVQVTLTDQQGKEVIRDVLLYMQGKEWTKDGEVSHLTIPGESIKWLYTDEEEDDK